MEYSDPMTKCVGSDMKGVTFFVMELLTGGRAVSELDPRNVAWAGSIQPDFFIGHDFAVLVSMNSPSAKDSLVGHVC